MLSKVEVKPKGEETCFSFEKVPTLAVAGVGPLTLLNAGGCAGEVARTELVQLTSGQRSRRSSADTRATDTNSICTSQLR